MPYLTIIAYALLVAFGVVDYAAHRSHYKHGPTVSATIWWLEKRAPILKVVVTGILVLGFEHLVRQAI